MASEITNEEQAHEPVLLGEVLEWLRPQQGGIFVDSTLGLGGHSEAILNASPETRVIGLDRDPQALALAEKRLSIFENRFQTAHASFADLAEVLSRSGMAEVQGVLADLGVSSLQFDRAERGFSFASEAPLDMRMDQSEGDTAADLVNQLEERELADLIFEYGEERGARKVARAIVRERERNPITTTRQLADIAVRALKIPGRWRIHPATRTFQALRIAVNRELEALENFVPQAVEALASGGRLAIISFHSLEDRIVKHSFQRESGRCICSSTIRGNKAADQQRAKMRIESIRQATHRQATRDDKDANEIVCSACGARNMVRVLTRKPLRPGEEEVERNPRSRSALLRVCEKL
jgi:16S rRNA (cytosine1402-N4)-methyltransferase